MEEWVGWSAGRDLAAGVPIALGVHVCVQGGFVKTLMTLPLKTVQKLQMVKVHPKQQWLNQVHLTSAAVVTRNQGG